MDVVISACKEAHVAECVRISLTSYERIHEVYTQLLGEEIHEGVMGSWRQNKAKTIERQQQEPNAVVALADGTVAGFVSYVVTDQVGRICNNAVDPAFRGMGIGRKLYAYALEGMKNDGAQYAMVQTGLDDGHAAARRVYQKVGFAKNVSRINYHQKLDSQLIGADFFENTRVKISKVKEEDLAACKELGLEAWSQFHEGYCQQLGKEIHDAAMGNWHHQLPAELEQQLQNQNGYVLKDGEQVVGFISFQVHERLGYIGYHAIAPAYRGQGLGERMYRHVLSEMVKLGAEYAQVSIGLDEPHIAARQVCRKTGFTQGLPSVWYYQKL